MSCSEWQKVRLGDVIEFNPKETIKKKQISKKVSMDKLDTFTRKINGYEEVEFTSGTKFRNGDTLLARITPCLENGKTAQVDILDDGEVAFGSTEFIVLREHKGITINKYIYYLSISPEFRHIAIKCMTGSSGRQRVQKDVLEDTEILLPPIEEQEKIADILSSLDDKIELNNEMNKTLEEMAQSIFKRWFVDFEFPNEDGEPYKSSGGEMVKSELGMIPIGWEVKEIGDTELLIEDGDRGKNYPNKSQLLKKGYCPFLNNKNIIDDKINFKDCDFISEERDKLLRKGKININDIVLTTRGSVGNVGILHEYLNYKFARINSGMVIIKNNSYLDLMYLYSLIKSDYMKLKYKNMITGTAQPQLPIKDIKKIKILIPKKNIQVECGKILKSLYDKIFENDSEIVTLSKKRDILLPKLISDNLITK